MEAVGGREQVGSVSPDPNQWRPQLWSGRPKGYELSLNPVMFAAIGLETPFVQAVALLAAAVLAIGPLIVRNRLAGQGTARARPAATREPQVQPTSEHGDDQPMICVLGPLQVGGCDWRLTPQQLSLITYLACGGTSSREAVVDALWDGRAVSTARFSNLLAETRSRIGRHHLPDAVDGRYRLVGITTDLDRFEAALDAASSDRSDDASVDRALALVRGVPFTPPSGRHWAWLDGRPEQLHRAELTVTDAVRCLVERYRAAGRPDRARLALEAGLLAAPFDESLTSSLVDVLVELGMVNAAKRLVVGWEQQMARLEGAGTSSAMANRLRTSLG